MDALFDEYVQYLLRAGVPVKPDWQPDRDVDHDDALIPPSAVSPRHHNFLGRLRVDEHFSLAAGLGSDHASWSVAHALLTHEPQIVGAASEIGCGTGVLAVILARLGAHPVVGTDIDREALDLAGLTAEENGTDIDLRVGSLCDPLRPAERFSVCVANLPHKPANPGDPLPIAQHGGPEGDSLFVDAIPCLFKHQTPGDRFYFFMHSLPHPRLLRMVTRYYEISPVLWKLRYLGEGEYPEMRDTFRTRHQQERSFIGRVGDREVLVSCVWRGLRRPEPLS